ncbi:MAG TPA: tetratricopeptide repeat protein [Caulobacteraceae bacterium]|nr:tetratricopeptide repeat protein [Caulobacteraceae bacterium]
MDLTGRQVALYGRFTPGVRDRLQRRIEAAGGSVARDLTRRGDALVVGALAVTLVASGALAARLAAARARDAPVYGEQAFAAALDGESFESTLPLATALAQAALTAPDAELLAAFDLIGLSGGKVRFGDAAILRTAGELLGAGRSHADVVRILVQARDLAPKGRHRIVLTGQGEAALEWHDGHRTTLSGQGALPLGEDHPGIDDLFEAAAIAEAEGDVAAALRLYDQCARADRSDPIAPYNLGNLRLAGRDADPRALDEAALAYRLALARDPGFVEARYNLAQALEAGGKAEEAAAELRRVLDADRGHADATFNLAQLTMAAGDIAAAKTLYERYLALGPPDAWAAMARKAILYCTARLTA